MRTLLKNIIAIPENYALFLNTLSLLEYIGARKIIKSQNKNFLTEKLLDHIIEELRHARILKRAAIKILPQCETYAADFLLCGEEAFHYFQTIDHAPNIELNENNPWHCYLYTSLLIEIRALNFYTACEEILQELGKPSPFKGIIIEEEKHLKEAHTWLTAIPNYEKNLAILKRVEETAFGNFLEALKEKTLSPPKL